jgi:NAD(P)-dependent dehydrogenase (short-subunit alcohol dehydrogenase family)
MNDYIESLFSLKNKIALVTGSSRGIGAAICNGFTLSGATTFGVGRSINPSGEFSGSYYRQCDVNDRKAFSSLCKEIYDKYSRIDILVNAAGISIPVGSDSSVVFEEIIATNLSSVYHCSQEVVEHMGLNSNGSIINITSIASAQGFPNNPGYVASKGGLRSLTKALAFDFSDKKIRVNNIAPGYIHTEMTNKSFSDKNLYEERLENMIIKRWGVPTDIVGAAIYLASDASSYVTGTDIFVDGGWSAKGI